jgi:dTDP-4-dehydrorhamnose reductase
MKRILITGANGQLGTSLKKITPQYEQFNYTYLDVTDLDLTNTTLVQQYFKNTAFDYVINCAAYTAVDQAEKQPDLAFSVNAAIPSLLGEICLKSSMRLLHLSTDYVYSGMNAFPHLEEEDPVALSVYAQSKLKGEMALWNNRQAMVIRTSWLYSEFGNNFLRSMLRLSKERDELGVVYDQTGTPTYAGHLAATLLNIIVHSEIHEFNPGIYNFSNEGVCSWYDFAVEIMQLARRNCTVKPIRTSEYPLPAKRPAYSVMDKTKIKNTFGLNILHWKQGLVAALKSLENNDEI